MVKNYTIIILIIAVLLLGAICIYTGGRVRDLDIRAGELAAENARLTEEIGTVTAESERIARELQLANDRLFKYEQVSCEITTGLSEIGEGIQGVLDRMRQYLP